MSHEPPKLNVANIALLIAVVALSLDISSTLNQQRGENARAQDLVLQSTRLRDEISQYASATRASVVELSRL